MLKLRTLVLLLIVVAAAAAGTWWWMQRPPAVEARAPMIGPAVEAVYATGTVEPIRWSEVASTVTARIVSYPAEEGDTVKTGDLLVQLDDTAARAALRELEAQIEYLSAEVERYEALITRQTVSQAALEKVQSELRRAQALWAVQSKRVRDLKITAPIDGVVLRTEGELGEVVQAGDVLVWVGQDRPYWITAQVDEEDIPRVTKGQEALLKADAFPGRVLEGKVVEITPMGDPINKQYRARILLPKDSPLLIGMTVEANIVVREEPNALLVPESALVDGGAVFVLEEGPSVGRRAVEVGVYTDGKLEIRDGISTEDRVIADPPEGLADGDTVKPRTSGGE
jgi:RND family efflux transporter MFP subunit